MRSSLECGVSILQHRDTIGTSSPKDDVHEPLASGGRIIEGLGRLDSGASEMALKHQNEYRRTVAVQQRRRHSELRAEG